MRSITLLAFLLFVNLVSCLCPSNCSCLSASIECSSCLSFYFRKYNTTSKDCDCEDAYTEMLPQQAPCRPKNCITYSIYGCVSCGSNAQISYSEISEAYSCVCKQNYVMVSDGSCKCNSHMLVSQFYESVKSNYCKKCPDGCVCNTNGCVSCQSYSMRTVVVDSGTMMVCPCNKPYVEINNICDIYSHCSINTSTNVVTCNNQSLRVQTSKGWQCVAPYTDVGGTCECLYPMLIQKFIKDTEQKQCACYSKKEYLIFYEYKGKCSPCPTDCTCSVRGCNSCNQKSNRYISGAGCPCKSPFIEFVNDCVCIEPYYTNISSTNCVCLSELFPTKFYNDTSTGICYACPTGCTCSTTGCDSCAASAMRMVLSNITSAVPNTCFSCQTNATLLSNGSCVCSSNMVLDLITNTCSCPITYSYNPSSTAPCQSCDSLCTCDASGCHSCDSTANRTTTLVGVYTSCPCKTGYTEVSGNCTCTRPFVVDSSWNCVCSEPYELSESTCQCKSINSPNDYYIDPATQECTKCPVGCICDTTGCKYCDPDTLRFSIATNGINQCPCIQTAFLIDGQCTFCQTNFMPINNQCVQCVGCATCDILGCLSCGVNATLNNRKCICNQVGFVNNNGICSCNIGYYLTTVGTCLACPVYCYICVFDAPTNSAVCTSCPLNANRSNSTTSNCPCVSGYKELSPMMAYCCAEKCKTCDLTGCLTCSAYANRVKAGNDCVCVDTYIDSGNGLCDCAHAMAEYGGKCIACPVHCNQCAYLTATPKCLSCPEDSHRNATDPDCNCIQNFVDVSLSVKSYCIPLYCRTYGTAGICIQCIDTRQLTQDGWACQCPVHTYDTESYGLCEDCNSVIEGCIDCASKKACLICDTAYSLVSITLGAVCMKNTNLTDFTYSQSWRGIRIQLRLTANVSSYTTAISASASLYKVYSSINGTAPVNEEGLRVNDYRKIGDDALDIFIENPTGHYEGWLFHLTYSMINYTRKYSRTINGNDSTGEYEGIQDSSSLPQPVVYSKSEVELTASWWYVLQNILTLMNVVAGLVLYVMGFKHNQISFFFQVFALMAYTIDDPLYAKSTILYPLKVAYYQIGDHTPLMSIPYTYLESSLGNFGFFDWDGNIYRVADITMLVAFLTGGLIGMLRIADFVNETTKLGEKISIKKLSKSSKKIIYRILEFFYKTCMMPLLFFSFATFRNHRDMKMLSGESTFSTVSLYTAIGFVSVYTAVTIWQWKWEIIAKVHRIENLCEYIFAFLTAFLLVFTIKTDYFLLIILVFLTRAIVYLQIRRRLLRDFLKVDYIKALVAVLQIMTLALIKSKQVEVLMLFVFLTPAVQLTHELLVLIKTAKIAKAFQKESVTATEPREVEYPDAVANLEEEVTKLDLLK